MEAEFYKEIFESNKEQLKEKIAQTMIDGFAERIKWNLPEEVADVIDEFVKEEVLPEVKASLTSDKEAIVKAATDMVQGVPEEIGKALQEHLAKGLSSSYNIKRILDALL